MKGVPGIVVSIISIRKLRNQGLWSADIYSKITMQDFPFVVQ